MLIQYHPCKFKAESLKTIEQANEIIALYEAQGFTLTLRQLYYQFVVRNLLPNTEKSYDNLGAVIGKARMAGLISWRAIEDRTRALQEQSHWRTPLDYMTVPASGYQIDRWKNQRCRLEVWVEKEALTGVVKGICEANDIPYFACRGYNSMSEQWAAGQRFAWYKQKNNQIPVIIHLGDHDPSGIDMTRDNKDRLSVFVGEEVEVRRIALNFDQVEEYSPPPNPAKLTDSR